MLYFLREEIFTSAEVSGKCKANSADWSLFSKWFYLYLNVKYLSTNIISFSLFN
jgi:hypothetical protein